METESEKLTNNCPQVSTEPLPTSFYEVSLFVRLSSFAFKILRMDFGSEQTLFAKTLSKPWNLTGLNFPYG